MMADRDPFELLPRFVDPEPDPIVMSATIARSREAFLHRKSNAAGEHSGSLWKRLQQSANWLVPAGAGAVALLAAIIVEPNLAPSSPVSPTSEPVLADRSDIGSPDQPAPQEPAIATGPEQAAPDGGVRMGMQPVPAPTVQDTETSTARQSSSFFEGNTVRVEARLTSFALELYLPDISEGRMIDSQGLLPGETAEVVAAFQIAERSIVAIRLNADGVLFWRAYRPVDGAYARDPALSALVSDAPDEAEARRRLATQ